MRRLTAMLLVALACRPQPVVNTSPGALQMGAESPRAAVETFLAAVRDQDLQAMSMIWGTEKGPARDGIKREQLEKSEIIMQCWLGHQRFKIVSDAPGDLGKRVLRVALSKGDVTRETNFITVQGPSSRWYVEFADLEPVEDLRKYPPNQCAG